MKVLILGGGGREHAIAWRLTRDEPALDLVAAPGNPGIATLGRCVRIDPSDPAAVVALAGLERPDLIVIGPEAPLAAGVSDACREAGFAVFGPSRSAARIESSKRFAKELMLGAGVPTARASWHADPKHALAAVRAAGAPVVVKASGLAAGKGVVVCHTVGEAEHAVESMMLQNSFGSAGAEVLVEEFMAGEELSVFALTDGEHFVMLPTSQDHKRLGDGDTGPNTGGMGAYAPASIATADVLETVGREVIGPTLRALREAGAPFAGLLYAGIMLTEHGPKVVEFNCRFGDPETQAVLPVLGAPLLPYLVGASRDGGLAGLPDPGTSGQYAVATVVASSGYPEAPRIGVRVVLPEPREHTIVFHSGTGLDDGGLLVSSGGRVVTVAGIGSTILEARDRSSAAVNAIQMPGAQFRSDIAWREVARGAGAT